jgi:hypothetical protein
MVEEIIAIITLLAVTGVLAVILLGGIWAVVTLAEKIRDLL